MGSLSPPVVYHTVCRQYSHIWCTTQNLSACCVSTKCVHTGLKRYAKGVSTPTTRRAVPHRRTIRALPGVALLHCGVMTGCGMFNAVWSTPLLQTNSKFTREGHVFWGFVLSFLCSFGFEPFSRVGLPCTTGAQPLRKRNLTKKESCISSLHRSNAPPSQHWDEGLPLAA